MTLFLNFFHDSCLFTAWKLGIFATSLECESRAKQFEIAFVRLNSLSVSPPPPLQPPTHTTILDSCGQIMTTAFRLGILVVVDVHICDRRFGIFLFIYVLGAVHVFTSVLTVGWTTRRA